MKVADLLKQNKPPNILIGGSAGSGKTCLVAQAAGGYLMDWDGHMKNVIQVNDRFSVLRNKIEIGEFVDEIVIDKASKPHLKASKYLEGKAKMLSCAQLSYDGKWPYDAFITDTITGLCRSIQLHVMACTGNPFKKPQIQDFGSFICELESILTIMRSMPVLKITTAHEMIIFGSQDQQITTRLMSATKPHGANKLAWLFDQVLMAKKRFRGGGRVEYIVTGKHEIAKGPITTDVVHNDIGLSGVLKLMGYSYGA